MSGRCWILVHDATGAPCQGGTVALLRPVRHPVHPVYHLRAELGVQGALVLLVQEHADHGVAVVLLQNQRRALVHVTREQLRLQRRRYPVIRVFKIKFKFCRT